MLISDVMSQEARNGTGGENEKGAGGGLTWKIRFCWGRLTDMISSTEQLALFDIYTPTLLYQYLKT